MSAIRKFATPSGADAHLDVPLSNLAISAFNDGSEGYVADQLFPAIPVGKQSDKYYILTPGSFLRTGDDLRAPKTKARRIEFDVSSDSYFADNRALANENALEDLANADQALMLRENSVRLVTGQLRRNQEIRIANTVTSISNIGSGVALTGGNKWSDALNSNPIADVTTAHAFIRNTTGLRANTLVMDTDTIQVLRTHPRLLDMYKYTSGGQVTNEQLAAVFRVSRILEASGIKENALEGGTSSLTNIWPNVAVLAHVGPATGMQSAVPGLRFRWRPEGIDTDFQVIRGVEAGAGSRKVEIVEANYYQAEKIVARNLAYAITGTL